MSWSERDFKQRPDNILDVDTVLDWVDWMLNVLEENVSAIAYQNCITVLDHLVACDEVVYGKLLPKIGVTLEKPDRNLQGEDAPDP